MIHLSDKVLKDLILITSLLVISFFLFSSFDVLESIVKFSQQHEEYEVDELLSTLVIFSLCMLVFSWRRIKEIEDARLRSEAKGQKLQRTLEEIKTLQGVIPICCYCNKIRDDQGAWSDMQIYINNHLDAEFSQGACPDCFEKRMNEVKNSVGDSSLPTVSSDPT